MKYSAKVAAENLCKGNVFYIYLLFYEFCLYLLFYEHLKKQFYMNESIKK